MILFQKNFTYDMIGERFRTGRVPSDAERKLLPAAG